jgi:hypothetical protein
MISCNQVIENSNFLKNLPGVVFEKKSLATMFQGVPRLSDSKLAEFESGSNKPGVSLNLRLLFYLYHPFSFD